jgi:hypothetical protein
MRSSYDAKCTPVYPIWLPSLGGSAVAAFWCELGHSCATLQVKTTRTVPDRGAAGLRTIC